MTNPPDDLEAVRNITKALEPFDAETRERIIRWVREKLGLPSADLPSKATAQITEQQPPSSPSKHKDIKTFVDEKRPATDAHFAATVAYFFKFEATEAEKKNSITADDLQEACRKVGRDRFKKPIWTLNNAHKAGLLDRAGEKGKFTINTVGENLVAIALPSGITQKATPRKKKTKKEVKRTPIKKT